MDKDKIKEIQIIDQNLYNLSAQKQAFQNQMIEVESALAEIEGSETTYKIIGNLMIKKDKDAIKKELQSKKEIIEIRIKSIEKQESQLKQRQESLQKELNSK